MSCEEKLDETLDILKWIKEQVQLRQDEQKIIIDYQKMILQQQQALRDSIISACRIREDVRSLRAGMKNC
jgi:hypothetical protein